MVLRGGAVSYERGAPVIPNATLQVGLRTTGWDGRHRPVPAPTLTPAQQARVLCCVFGQKISDLGPKTSVFDRKYAFLTENIRCLTENIRLGRWGRGRRGGMGGTGLSLRRREPLRSERTPSSAFLRRDSSRLVPPPPPTHPPYVGIHFKPFPYHCFGTIHFKPFPYNCF